MLSIKPSTQGWIGPGDFNSHLSGIIWVVQLLFFFDSARKEKDGGGETLAQVKQYCERYLQQTVETPMGEILRWRLLLFRVSKDTVGDHEAFWDESEQVLTYEDVEWHMDQIPTLLESEYRDCRRLLYDDLMFGVTGILHMHAWTLRDSANVDTVGWDFTQHRDNGHLSMGVGMALLTAIERSDSISRLFLVNARQSSSGLAWRESALATSGQPLRESEFFAMTWRNTQRRRSITLCHERVVIHVRYHKGQQQTGRYKDNIRFLAQPIGDLLLDYIVYVMPLRQIFLRQQSPKALLSPFLWEKNGKVWADGQLSRHLGEASARACVPRLHVSNWRQMTVAIVKTKFVSQISVFEANDQDEDAEEVDDNIRIMTRQRNHKTQTVNRAYANQIGAAYGNVWDGLIRMGLRASTLWQDFWGVEVTLKGQKRGRAKVESWLAKRVAMGVYRPRKPWSAEALLAGAKKLYDAGVTVLVVPLVSLRGDVLRRLRELRIDHIEWSSGERRESGLVLVTAEAASTKDFMIYAQALIAQQKLDRVVVDECHLTVTAASYRESIVDVTLIRSLPTQFVYLTATLPPSMYAEFEERNYLLHPKVIRASSNRPNFFYMVRKIKTGNGSLLEQAAAEAQDAWNRSNLFNISQDKIILYVRTRDEAIELASLLDCTVYTARSGSAVDKGKIVADWIKSVDQPYIVATTAFAEGFDYPYVRLVINVNEPESLVLFAQESGRAGRDGERAYSFILLPSTWMAIDGDNGDQGVAQPPAIRDSSLGAVASMKSFTSESRRATDPKQRMESGCSGTQHASGV
ncbi:hypothetical protein LTR29_018106 [Friedmanniomyces endolithicus]|nr:hypothetical protein LTR29_018106 [Friedmanniomyces endolithicus]